MRPLKSFGLFLILIGITLFLISSIPITRTDEMIDTSFTIGPGDSFDPYDIRNILH